MKRILKIASLVAGALVLLLLAAAAYFFTTYPDVDPAPAVTVERTPERLARGRYLARSVMVCIDCHSTRDWSKFAGPIVPGTDGMGGEEFNEQNAGVPGRVYAGNITPAGIGSYTDGELLRSVTCGVTNTGRALFPLMPYGGYAQLTQEDAFATVAYLRTLPPIEHAVEESELDFPVNLIVRTMPLTSYTPRPEADRSDTRAYGEYLAAIAGCVDCHTPAEKGTRVAGMEYAGGFFFPMPQGGRVGSSNITPDPETGIGSWSRDEFVERFTAFRADDMRSMPVGPGEFNTPMPWTMYATMTDEDLGAMYDYLRTVKPVRNAVEVFAR